MRKEKELSKLPQGSLMAREGTWSLLNFCKSSG